MIKSLAELEYKIDKGEEFECKDQANWHFFDPRLAIVADVTKMMRENRLRIKEKALIDAMVIYKPHDGGEVVTLKPHGTEKELINNFKAASFQYYPRWGKLIDRNTGKILDVYYQPREDPK